MSQTWNVINVVYHMHIQNFCLLPVSA